MVQGWWPNLMQGAVSAVIGGVVAALTAWAVVAAGRRHERRLALEFEARASAIELFVMLAAVDTSLRHLVENGTRLPNVTESSQWAINVLRAEVAMYSLDRATGRNFSRAVGDLRRALELVEDVDGPAQTLVESAVSALQRLSDHLADWLMDGRHRD